MGYKHQIEDIIAIGSELIRKNGYHNVGVNDILKSCNIPKGSFYNFFYSKEDFALQVMDTYGENGVQRIRATLGANDASPLQRLKQFYSENIDFNELDGLDSGCLINNMSVEMGGINEKLSQKSEQVMQEMIDVIAECVAEGQKTGEIIDHMPARDIAEFLHTGMFGAFSRMKVNKSREYLDKWHRMSFDYISI